MFGFGKEAHQRREGMKLIRAGLDAEVDRRADIRAHLGLAPEKVATTSHGPLAEKLMAGVSKWPTRSFAGQVMPKPSAMGLALEALSYGLDRLGNRPADQQLVLGALGKVLSFAAKNQDKMNDADYELFQILGARYVSHPLVKEATQKAA